MTASRHRWLRRGLWLSSAILVWNVIEGVVAVSAGVIASSVALVSFGVDSAIEVLSAMVVVWRLQTELRKHGGSHTEKRERQAARITGGLLLVLAAYIFVEAGRRLLGFGPEARTSLAGIVLTSLSLVLMPAIGWAKLRTAKALRSASLRADAFETITCAWLSLTTLTGLALNAALGWSWADPIAALLILPLVIRESFEALGSGKEGRKNDASDSVSIQ